MSEPKQPDVLDLADKDKDLPQPPYGTPAAAGIDLSPLKNVPAALPYGTQEYKPRHAREKTRTWLAIATLSLFGVEIVGPFLLLITHTLTMAEIKDLLGIQFAAVASLAGSTLGFYFGSKSAKGDDVDGGD